VFRPFGAMTLNFKSHLLIAATLRCRDENHAHGLLGELLRVPAFTAAHTT
jgi:hypothetical protein